MSSHSSRWADIGASITPADAVDIDDLISPYDDRAAKDMGSAIFPDHRYPDMHAGFRSETAAVIGYRMREKPQDLASVAMKLATFAAEKGAEVVILSDLAYSGLERFGFRVERVCGETTEERESCAEQIRSFWAMDLVL